MYIHKYQEKELHKEQKLKILFIFPLTFMILGILFSYFDGETNLTLSSGLKNILISPSILITDFLSVGGIGPTFVNVSLISFYNLYLLKKYKLRINGLILAAFMTVMGFSFFGKNIFNIIPIYMGGYLYSYHKKIDFKDIIVSIMFATALAPVISEISFSNMLPSKIAILLGIGVGIFIGFIITPLASHMVKFYDGYNIYNLGFTAGILGTILTSALKSLDIKIESVNILYLENKQECKLSDLYQLVNHEKFLFIKIKNPTLSFLKLLAKQQYVKIEGENIKLSQNFIWYRDTYDKIGAIKKLEKRHYYDS